MIGMLKMSISQILNEFARGNFIFKVVTNCILLPETEAN